ncbi:MAG: PilZ domain-containing protein [Candidatus Acidiferrales bacterium]
MTTRENGNNEGAGDQAWTATRAAKRLSSLRDLSVTYEGHSEDVVTRPPDISTRGMFINTTRVFPEGAVLNVRFRLAISGHEIHSRAEVRYCLPGVGVGVEFIDISREDVQAIDREIEMRTEMAEKL